MNPLCNYIEEGILNRDAKSTVGGLKVELFRKYANDMGQNTFSFWNGEGNDVVSGSGGLEIVVNDDRYDRMGLFDVSGKCPEFNINKITNRSGGPFFFEIHSPMMTDIKGLFAPNCKFVGDECQLFLDGLKCIEDLSGLPREMKNVSLSVGVWPRQCVDILDKIEYKDEDEFLEPYKKFIDTVPKCSSFYIYIHFGDIYDRVKRKLKINGEKPKVNGLRDKIIDFCEKYYKKITGKSCKVYTIG